MLAMQNFVVSRGVGVMTEKIRSWWSDDGKWFCILANEGVNQATVSLTPEQAEQLARKIAERKLDS